MPIVKAGPNQYLLIGRQGKLENRGSAIEIFLLPGTIYVLVPSTKQETTFEFTQETKDGIPLRFKGIILYRITNPVAAARLFDFSLTGSVAQINTLLTHICLGELRDAVSHMSMVNCIEQRKTSLTQVVETALQKTIHGADGQTNDWGIEVEAAQVAQVFIVDAELRKQLEAEVRNEIKVKSDQSNINSQEAIHHCPFGSRISAVPLTSVCWLNHHSREGHVGEGISRGKIIIETCLMRSKTCAAIQLSL